MAAKYLNDEEIRLILGYKTLKSYNNSKKSKESIDKLIEKLTIIIESKYNNQIKALKDGLINHIKEL